MKNNVLELKMRKFETINDEKINPDMYIIARIDGSNFHTLTRKILNVKGYDTNLANVMKYTLVELTNNKDIANIDFSYTQSDEISLIINKDDLKFNGKIRKFNSLLASYTSVVFNKYLREFFPINIDIAPIFDCRIIQLPTLDHVIDYFNWRRSDAEKNCLSLYVYSYMMNVEGLTGSQAANLMDKKGYDWKNEYLYKNHGINFNEIPQWQKTGRCCYWIPLKRNVTNKKTLKNYNIFDKQLHFGDCPRNVDEFNDIIKKSIELNGLNTRNEIKTINTAYMRNRKVNISKKMEYIYGNCE